MTAALPPWLPEWTNADELAGSLDIEQLRRDASDLINYVFTEDYSVLDSLPEAVESNIVGVLGTLASVLDQSGTDVELVVAARLVRRSLSGLLDDCPSGLVERIATLPE